ncbi:MAG TPA: CDP-alcohol phosphatidyltransferase family protein [Candidatus Paceibacterota bacterium]
MEKRQKIRQFLRKKKDDLLTAMEKNWRDNLFRPLTNFLGQIGITANHLTIASYLLLLVPIGMHFQGYPLGPQIILLGLIGLADAIDGPLARNNKNVTILGIWLDHLRDGSLVAWATYLLFSYQVLSLEFIGVIWGLQIILLWITLKDFVIQYLKHNQETSILIHHLSHNNLQASVLGRLQFFFWTIAYLFFFLYILSPSNWLLTIGHTLIVIEIIFAAMSIFDAYQKFLPKK